MYLSEFREKHGWTWLEMEKQYLLNPELFITADVADQLLAQTGVGGLNAAALMIAADRLDGILTKLEILVDRL